MNLVANKHVVIPLGAHALVFVPESGSVFFGETLLRQGRNGRVNAEAVETLRQLLGWKQVPLFRSSKMWHEFKADVARLQRDVAGCTPSAEGAAAGIFQGIFDCSVIVSLMLDRVEVDSEPPDQARAKREPVRDVHPPPPTCAPMSTAGAWPLAPQYRATSGNLGGIAGHARSGRLQGCYDPDGPDGHPVRGRLQRDYDPPWAEK